jgi:hypothetical protein
VHPYSPGLLLDVLQDLVLETKESSLAVTAKVQAVL